MCKNSSVEHLAQLEVQHDHIGQCLDNASVEYRPSGQQDHFAGRCANIAVQDSPRSSFSSSASGSHVVAGALSSELGKRQNLKLLRIDVDIEESEHRSSTLSRKDTGLETDGDKQVVVHRDLKP